MITTHVRPLKPSRHWPRLNPDPAASKRLYVVSLLALLTFGGLWAGSAISLLQSSGNLSPIHLLVKSKTGQPVSSETRVSVVTRWSEMELVREGDVWSFPEGQIRAVPQIVVTFADAARASENEFFLSTKQASVADTGAWPTRDWIAVPHTALPENVGTVRLDVPVAASLVLKLLKRPLINWKGDLWFLASAAIVPFTQVFFLWLLIAGLLWFRGAMKAGVQGAGSSQSFRDSAVGLRIDGLDHIRGVAILMVYAYHCLFATFGFDQLGWNGWFRSFDHDSRTFLALAPVTFGFGGVAIFFALSGFCIHLSYERSRDRSWNTYFCRRLFRIYPPYLVALLFFGFFYPLTRVDFTYNGLSRFYSCLFLYFNLTPDTYWTINGSFWSVAVEMQLYLVYPLLCISARYVGWRPVLWIAFLIEIGLKFPSSELSFLAPNVQFPFALQMGPFGYVFSWLIGAKLADDYLTGRALTFRRVPMLVWFSLLTISLTFKPATPFQFLLFSLTTVGIIARCVEGKSFRIPIPLWLKKHIAWVGMISYSVYLLHQPFLNLAPRVVRWLWSGDFVHPAWQLLSCVAVYPLILGLSWLMYRYMELPGIAAGKWFVSRNPSDSLAETNAGPAGIRMSS